MLELLYQKYQEANRVVCTDTRNITPGCLFFCLKGDNFDGNKFAETAIKNGAVAAVIDNKEYATENTLLVEDTLKALQDLARYYRKISNFKVFGLTGTNGKTTTKELLLSVVKQKYKSFATKGNLNNHIGVPLTILSTPPSTELLIVEMGANHVGEIAMLCEICMPNYGLITNIGKAHLEGFGSFDGVLKAKTELYNYLISNNGTIFINKSDGLLWGKIENYYKKEAFGSPDTACFVESERFENQLTTVLKINNEKVEFTSQLFGTYNTLNILAAVKVGTFFNVPFPAIVNAIASYTPQNNRSQILTTARNKLIMDSYNANPTSMQAALSSFNKIQAPSKGIILGSMKELGKDSNKEHQALLTLARKNSFDFCLVVGKEYKDFTGENEIYFESTTALIEYLKLNQEINNFVILIKGSRSNKLETIEPYL